MPPSTPGGHAGTIATTTAVGELGSIRSAPVELIDVETELFELPQKQRVFYTKQVQTADVGDSDDEYDPSNKSRSFGGPGPSGGVGAEARTRETEESLRAKILAEHQADLAARQEEERLEREIAQQLRELTEDERIAVYSAQDFSEFVEQSTKIVERALTDTYDYMRDYRISADDSLDAANSGSQLRIARRFGVGDKRLPIAASPPLTGVRSIQSCAWWRTTGTTRTRMRRTGWLRCGTCIWAIDPSLCFMLRRMFSRSAFRPSTPIWSSVARTAVRS